MKAGPGPIRIAACLLSAASVTIWGAIIASDWLDHLPERIMDTMLAAAVTITMICAMYWLTDRGRERSDERALEQIRNMGLALQTIAGFTRPAAPARRATGPQMRLVPEAEARRVPWQR